MKTEEMGEICHSHGHKKNSSVKIEDSMQQTQAIKLGY
jgi:hypothetical protein